MIQFKWTGTSTMKGWQVTKLQSSTHIEIHSRASSQVSTTAGVFLCCKPCSYSKIACKIHAKCGDFMMARMIEDFLFYFVRES